MIHEDDESFIRRMTGLGEMTPAIEREYSYRVSMMNRCGHVGPIGLGPLTDMLRFLGIEPEVKRIQHGRVDPRQLRADDKLMVKCANGKSRAAEYKYSMGNGVHAVTFDGDPMVREVKAHQMYSWEELEEEGIDWDKVDKGTEVVAVLEEDGAPVEAAFVGHEDGVLRIIPSGQKKHFKVNPDNVALKTVE